MPTQKAIWRLRSYVENLEFRSNNIKITAKGNGLSCLIEWVIASYKCAVFANKVAPVSAEKARIADLVKYRMLDLKEEEEEMWNFEEAYRAQLAQLTDAEQALEDCKKRIRELQRVLDTIDLMREEARIPATLEDDVEVEILGTGNVTFHQHVIENVEPRAVWDPEAKTEEELAEEAKTEEEKQEDAEKAKMQGTDVGPKQKPNLLVRAGDLIDLFSPTSRQVFPYTVVSVGEREITVKETVYMVSEKMVHIRRRGGKKHEDGKNDGGGGEEEGGESQEGGAVGGGAAATTAAALEAAADGVAETRPDGEEAPAAGGGVGRLEDVGSGGGGGAEEKGDEPDGE